MSIEIIERTKLYSPYDLVMQVDYSSIFDHPDTKITNCETVCDLPETTMKYDGTIQLDGIHDYPISGETNIKGTLYCEIPVYVFKLNFYKVRYIFFSNNKHLKFVESITEEKLQSFLDDDENTYDEYHNDITNEIEYDFGSFIIKKQRYVMMWTKCEPLIVDRSFKIWRNFSDKSGHFLGNHTYNVRKIIIEPLMFGTNILGNSVEPPESVKKNNHDNIRLVMNDMTYYVCPNDYQEKQYILDFDDPKCLEKMGMLGIFLEKYETIRFNFFALKEGSYNNYKITYIDHKPTQISF